MNKKIRNEVSYYHTVNNSDNNSIVQLSIYKHPLMDLINMYPISHDMKYIYNNHELISNNLNNIIMTNINSDIKLQLNLSNSFLLFKTNHHNNKNHKYNLDFIPILQSKNEYLFTINNNNINENIDIDIDYLLTFNNNKNIVINQLHNMNKQQGICIGIRTYNYHKLWILPLLTSLIAQHKQSKYNSILSMKIFLIITDEFNDIHENNNTTETNKSDYQLYLESLIDSLEYDVNYQSSNNLTLNSYLSLISTNKEYVPTNNKKKNTLYGYDSTDILLDYMLHVTPELNISCGNVTIHHIIL